ncbi:MAG: 2'-5' RNA ligase family protein [Nanoarchaeota archaeon]|nr:2'-5' RNA ligase family protein [Nanoarchaeota archaeon]
MKSRKGCANSKPFEINIAGIGAFPNKCRARVIWLSAGNGVEEFKRLMKNIDMELSKIGFVREKDYVPRLTLARMRSGKSNAELIKPLERIEAREVNAKQSRPRL